MNSSELGPAMESSRDGEIPGGVRNVTRTPDGTLMERTTNLPELRLKTPVEPIGYEVPVNFGPL
jgi:hypothetical protein